VTRGLSPFDDCVVVMMHAWCWWLALDVMNRRFVVFSPRTLEIATCSIALLHFDFELDIELCDNRGVPLLSTRRITVPCRDAFTDLRGDCTLLPSRYWNYAVPRSALDNKTKMIVCVQKANVELLAPSPRVGSCGNCTLFKSSPVSFLHSTSLFLCLLL
jgi:hypothetical protein